MATRMKIGLAWALSCVLAGTLGWIGHWYLRPTPTADGSAYSVRHLRASGRGEVQVADDQHLLLVARQGNTEGTLRSVCAYSGEAAVFFTNHHENGEVKEE